MSEFSTCKVCLEDYPTDELIWGDKGGFHWVCEGCYKGGEIK